MSKEVKKLSLKEVRYISFKFARMHLEWDEEIPPFDTANLNVLESSLQTPFQSFQGEYMYSGITGKAAALFYFLIKNHPFQNGNKRLAITITLDFLAKNGKWASIPTENLYELSKIVAKSDSKKSQEMISVLKEKVFDEFIVDF